MLENYKSAINKNKKYFLKGKVKRTFVYLRKDWSIVLLEMYILVLFDFLFITVALIKEVFTYFSSVFLISLIFYQLFNYKSCLEVFLILVEVSI